MPKFDDIMVNQ